MPHSGERLVVLIDGSNHHSAVKRLGFDTDYKKLREWCKKQGRLVRSYYFTALPAAHVHTSLRLLTDWLQNNHYTLITKQTTEYTKKDGTIRIKGDMDIEIAITALELAPHVDHIMLFSGDSDFAPLVEALQRQGKHVTVVSTTETNPTTISKTLKQQTDDFIELTDLKKDIGKDTRHPGVKPTQ